MPIYYATGSRWKGFWWSVMSGISEPIGGLVGYLVLYGDNMSELAYGGLFGAVGGMMVRLSPFQHLIDDDVDGNKPVWPTWSVGALFRGVRRVHYLMMMITSPFGQLGQWAFSSGMRDVSTSTTYVFTYPHH
jgi:hypothetical protein